jgi:hypothetical protein
VQGRLAVKVGRKRAISKLTKNTMGRYYTGDIEGKFWFGVQDSNDARFFGGDESEPSYIEYFFDGNDLDDIKFGIQECTKALGKNLNKLNTFFKKNDCYSDEQLTEYLGIDANKEEVKGIHTRELQEILTWYARLDLGRKILKCVQKHGDCSFQAET